MVHDPRAPRIAAMATLGAAILVILTAVNLIANVIGAPGLSIEEGGALLSVLVFLLIARFANKQREIPELTTRSITGEFETFSSSFDQRPSQTQTEVNPTTASILTSILGEQQRSDEQQVSSAINTLSSGEFGASVQRTMEAVEAANQTNIAPREAAPADEETGKSLERVLVQPVPLPGREELPTVNPATIPGLEPNRVFVTNGMASVPLPTDESTPNPPVVSQAPPTPSIPDLPDLPEPMAKASLSEPVEAPPALDLPDLDDLFTEVEPAPPSVPDLDLPELPDIDDLF